jgi:hypothetical protein
MAPDFDRLARSPWPEASLTSSGTSAFSSALARSWSTATPRVNNDRGGGAATWWLPKPIRAATKATIRSSVFPLVSFLLDGALAECARLLVFCK